MEPAIESLSDFGFWDENRLKKRHVDAVYGRVEGLIPFLIYLEP